MTKKILVLPGDGIGPEIVAEAEKVLKRLQTGFGLAVEIQHALIGGAAIDATGHPLPDETLDLAQQADAVLLGAVGGPQWESLDISLRPEKGLLGIRSGLGDHRTRVVGLKIPMRGTVRLPNSAEVGFPVCSAS